MSSSKAITSSASSTSCVHDRLDGAAQRAQHELALARSDASSWSSSSWKRDAHLSEPPRHVVLGPLVGRGREDLRRLVVLDEDAGALPPSLVDLDQKNAVMSATRAACCMLWVTITIVYSRLSSCIRSSIRVVEIGSSAEAGSSIRITSGSTARQRAMQSRCCWPPERPSALLLQPVLDLVPERRLLQRLLDALVEARPSARARAARRRRCRRSTSGTGSASGRPCRSGVAPRPGRRRRRRGPCRGRGRCPRPCAPGTRSFMRSKQRMSVLLPQPRGR